MSELRWWGYRHQSGSVQVKRYWGDRASIQDAYDSDFVARVVEPFVANSREEALKIVAAQTGVNTMSEKLGPTGEFPQGKLNPADEGELRLAVGVEAGMSIANCAASCGAKPNHATGVPKRITILHHARIAADAAGVPLEIKP